MRKNRASNESSLRTGMETYAEVSAFLAGIFFTGIILLLEQKDPYGNPLQIFALEIPYLRILDVVAIPLAFSFTMFMFSALAFAAGNIKRSAETAEAVCNAALNMFTVGFISIFVSLFLILLFVSPLVAIMEVILAIIITAYWLKKTPE